MHPVKILHVTGFGIELPATAHSLLEAELKIHTLTLDELLPGYAPTAQAHRLDKTSHKPLGIISTRILTEVFQHQVEVLVFNFGNACLASHLHILLKIRNVLPGLKLIITGTLDLFVTISLLETGRADLAVLSPEPGYWLRRVGDLLDNPRSIEQPRVLWADTERQIQSNSKKAKRTTGAKVLLVLMPAFNTDQMPPLGIASVATALEMAGFRVDSLDLNSIFWNEAGRKNPDFLPFKNINSWSSKNLYQKEIRPLLDTTCAKLCASLQNDDYRYVGFSLFQTNLLASDEAFQITQQSNRAARIFCGGPSCTPAWAQKNLTANRVHAAVFGEGEESATALLQAWESGDDPGPIAGVWRRDRQGQIIIGGARSSLSFASLPIPDFSGFDVYHNKKLELPVAFSRGCVAKCVYCYESPFWRTFRASPVKQILATMEQYVLDLGIRRFGIADSLMNGNHRLLEELSEALIARDLRVQYTGFCRLDPKLTLSLLNKLHASGCAGISFGLESGSQRVLDWMKKDVKMANIPEILKNTRTAGIWCGVCVMVGFPGESWWDFLKTLVFVARMRKWIDNLNSSIFMAPEGTPVQEVSERFGIVVDERGDEYWRTRDFMNTHGVRVLRLSLLNGMWKLLKKKRASPENWDYEYRQQLGEPKMDPGFSLARLLNPAFVFRRLRTIRSLDEFSVRFKNLVSYCAVRLR